MCVGIVLYIACNARLYGTVSIDDYYAISRIRMYGTAVFHVALLAFAGAYTGVRLRRYGLVIAIIFAGFTAARHFFPPFLDSTVRGIALHSLPWGGQISMIDLTPGGAFIAYQSLVILTYIIVFITAAIQFNRGQKRKAVLLSGSALVLFAALIHDTAVFNMSLNWPMISEAGFTGIILLVGVVISDEVARSAAMSEEVAAGERRFHAIFNSTFQFIGLLDKSGRILEVNEPALAFIGQSAERVRGLWIWEAPWWRGLDDDKRRLRDAAKAAADGNFVRLATRHVSDDGAVAHFDFSLKPVLDSAGRVELILAEGRDVSEIREAADTIARNNEELAAVNEELTASIEELEASNEAFEEQNRELVSAQEDLRNKEAELRRLVDNAPAAIYRQSLPDGRLTFIGGRCTDLFGYTNEELLEHQELFDRIMEFDWREYLRKAWYYINRGIDPPTVDYCITHRSGEKKWLSQRSILIRGGEGEPLALEGIVYDITGRRLAEEALQRSEFYLASILRSTPDIIYRLDPKGVITYINDAIKKYGYESARVVGTSLLDYVHPDDMELARHRINERRTGERATRFLELRIFTPVTGTVHIEYSASAIQATPVFLIHAEGLYDCPIPEPEAFIGTQGIARDITERKRAEESLRESEQGLRAFIDQSFEGIIIVDEDGLVMEWNPVTERLSGISRREAVGTTYWDILYRLVPRERRTEERHIEIERAVREALRTGKPRFSGPRHFEHERADGTRGYTEQIAFPIKTSKGFRFGSISHDVTDRHLLEKTLRESADRFRMLIESSPLPILLARGGTLIFVNGAFRRLVFLGENDPVEGMNLLDFVAEEKRPEVESYVSARLHGEAAPSNYESIGLRSDGSTFPYEISVATVELPDGPATLAYVRDISERKSAETALAETIENLHRSQEIAHVGNWRLDLATSTFSVSEEGLRIWGFPPNYRPSMEEVSRRIHPDDREMVGTTLSMAIEQGISYSVEYRISHRDTKEPRHIHALGELQRNGRGEPDSVFGILQDITENRRIQEEKERIQGQLIQAQKMEAVGTLAGGIAHDFNNLLGGIMGGLSLIELSLKSETLSSGNEITNYVHTAIESAQRAAGMIRRLLAVSRRQEMHMGPVDLNRPLENVLKICSGSLPKSVRLDFRLPGYPLIANADSSQLEQVFLNLCLNASHAMTIMRSPGEKEGGILTVTLESVDGDVQIPNRCPGGEPHARIRFEDTGVGMDEEVSRRVFEPFYTTKRKENGTGLGLSVAYGIIEQHGGLIHLSSEKGEGSTFNVYLPLIEQGARTGESRGRDTAMVHGKGRILVIDDEQAILNVARGILTASGYEVLTAQSGEEGIRSYSSGGSTIDAVLLDLSLPGLSGLEIFERLSAIDPGVRVLLSSGFAEDDRVRAARDMGIRGFIQKPYTAVELSAKISEIMS